MLSERLRARLEELASHAHDLESRLMDRFMDG